MCWANCCSTGRRKPRSKAISRSGSSSMPRTRRAMRIRCAAGSLSSTTARSAAPTPRYSRSMPMARKPASRSRSSTTVARTARHSAAMCRTNGSFRRRSRSTPGCVTITTARSVAKASLARAPAWCGSRPPAPPCTSAMRATSRRHRSNSSPTRRWRSSSAPAPKRQARSTPRPLPNASTTSTWVSSKRSAAH